MARARLASAGLAVLVLVLVLALALALALGALWPAPLAAAPATTQVHAKLDARHRRVSGSVEIAFDNPAGFALDRVYFWLLPNRMARMPRAVTDTTFYWVYPRRFSPGAMSITAARAGILSPSPQVTTSAIAGPLASPRGDPPLLAHALVAEPHAVAGAGVLWSVRLPAPALPGQRVHMVLSYSATIPERYGALGCIHSRCTLAGGFYPMLAGIDGGGWDLEGPPMTTDMDVTVDLAQPGSLVLFDEIAGQLPGDIANQRGEARERDARYPLAVRIQVRRQGVPYAPLEVAPRLYESTRQASSDGKPVTLRYLSTRRPPPADDAYGKILPYTLENHARFALEATGEALSLLDEVKAHAAAPAIVLVETPLREDLAENHPGAVLVSDRFYRIFPAERFRKLHRRQLVRAVFAALLDRAVRQRGNESTRDVATAADLIAAYLVDLYTVRRYSKKEHLGNMLQPASFIPMVDMLLYETRTMFASAYFGGILDDELLRDHPERFMHQRPRGRLYYEKLRDLLSPEALREALRSMIAGQTDFRHAAEEAHRAPLDWFFRQWSLPYPRHDYQLASITSSPPENGLREHAITIVRKTAPADSDVIEPVIVRVILEDGTWHDLRWDGQGPTGTVHLRAASGIDRVELDPGARLVERELPGQNQDPRYGNRTSPPLRFVYNKSGLLLNVTDLSAALAADFTLARIYDRRDQLRMGLYSSASALVGGLLSYRRSFGPVVTPDRLLSRLSVTLGAARLRGDYFGDPDARPATQLTLDVSFRRSSRTFLFHPKDDSVLGLSASLAMTRRDASGDDSAELLLGSNVAAALARTFTPAAGHTLAGELSAGLVFGDLETRAQLVAPGGIDGVRGYAGRDLFGRAFAMARAEYRHIFSHELDWNIGHYNIVRGVGGAFFADAVALSPCSSYDLASADSIRASVGYGLHFYYDSFGTLPLVMRIDVAARLTGRAPDCLGAAAASSPPVAVYISFWPPF